MGEQITLHPGRQVSGLVLKSLKGKSREAFGKTAKNKSWLESQGRGQQRQDLKTCRGIRPPFSRRGGVPEGL